MLNRSRSCPLARCRYARPRQPSLRAPANHTRVTLVAAAAPQYFLTQKLKPGCPDYLKKLALHHLVLVASMKAKQNVSSSFADELDAAIADLSKIYAKPHSHSH